MKEKPIEKVPQINIRKENETPQREMEIHFIRHAEPAGYALDAGITQDGCDLSVKVGKQLLEKIGPNELVKFVTSPFVRSQQTLQALVEGFQDAMKDQDRKDVQVYFENSSRKRKTMTMFAIDRKSKWYQSFKESDDKMGFWLSNPTDATDSPEVVLSRFNRFIHLLTKMANRLPPGPKINYIVVTHSGPMRAFLQDVYNTDVGDPEFCESFTLQILDNDDSASTIKYKNTETSYIQHS